MTGIEIGSCKGLGLLDFFTRALSLEYRGALVSVSRG